MPPKVSVGIVTHGSAAHIGRCLEAVRAQTIAPDEVVVWDNASSDGSADLARAHGAVVIVSPLNIGFAGAANELVRRTTAPYLLLLNPDAFLAPDYLARLQAAAEADPRIGAVAGKLLRPAERAGRPIIDSTGHVLYRNRVAANRGEGEPDQGQFDQPGEVFGVCAAAALYRRAMLEDVRVGDEYFDSSFFAYLEDVDLDWRARLRGWTAHYVPAAVAVHERGHRGKRRLRQPGILRHSLKNRYLMILKNDRPVDLLRDAPAVLLAELIRFIDFALVRPASLRGYLDVLRLVPRTLAARRVIQRRRLALAPDARSWFYRYPLAAKIRSFLRLRPD